MSTPSFSLRACLPFSFAAALAALAGCGGGGEGAGGAGGDAGPAWEPLPVPAEGWSHGDPSPLEQQSLELIQRARISPSAEVDSLLKIAGVQSAMKQYGIDEATLRADFSAYPAVQPLSFDARLLDAARGHSEDMAENGFQDHTGSDGRTFDQRIDAAGYAWSFASENVFAYAQSVPYCHAAFLVD